MGSRRGGGCDRVRWRKAVRDGIRVGIIIMESRCALFYGGLEEGSQAEGESGTEAEAEADSDREWKGKGVMGLKKGREFSPKNRSQRCGAMRCGAGMEEIS